MQRIAILGLGLMGGSLGMALRRRGGWEVRGYARREVTRKAALQNGAVDAAFDRPEDAAEGAQVVVACVPIRAVPDLIRRAATRVGPGSILTDVGSTKAWLAQALCGAGAEHGATYVGSHPMAGSEATGIEAARPDLYERAIVFVTPNSWSAATQRATRCLCAWWEGIGACPVVVTPSRHDRIVARTSHVVHLVAGALVANLCGRGGRAWREWCGPGFLDTTRVAAGSDAMWVDILRTNRAQIRGELAAVERGLGRVRKWLEAEDWYRLRQWLARCGRFRQEMQEG